MKPIKFAEANVTYAENQPEYIPLPAFKLPQDDGECISCWQLSWGERFKILFKGKLWLSMLTFNKPLTPTLLTVNKSDVITPDKINDEMEDK